MNKDIHEIEHLPKKQQSAIVAPISCRATKEAAGVEVVRYSVAQAQTMYTVIVGKEVQVRSNNETSLKIPKIIPGHQQ